MHIHRDGFFAAREKKTARANRRSAAKAASGGD